LNRPDIGNAIHLAMAQALLAAAIEIEENDAIRCVLLTGSGRFFCVGGDVRGFADAGDALPASLSESTKYFHDAMSRLARMSKPLVTAINGPTAGAGVGLAILGDLALAARSAHFTLGYTAIGLTPDGGSSWLLPRLIGLRRSQELLLTNRRVIADEALEMGLVTRVIDDDALSGEAMLLAKSLAASATGALGKTRKLLLSSFEATFETQLGSEARTIAEAGATSEGREGIQAFIDKRKPNFHP
jgi:2-(1,2-epoxy-1,2-dihydrophenyl)acetyl-CoA isomerase